MGMVLKRFVPLVVLGLMIVTPVLAAAGHPGHEPGDPSGWVETNSWTGMISYGVGTPALILSEDNYNARDFTVEEDLKTLVVGMEWDPAVPFSGPLRILLEEYGVEEAGKSPIEFRLDEGDDFDPISGTKQLRFVVTPPYELSLYYQQPFTVYYHEFYGEHAPAGYSALPDA